MQYELKINYKGKAQELNIENSVYQGKQTYEVSYEGQFFIMYREGDKWQQDQDHEFDGDWLTAIGTAIESHSWMNSKVSHTQNEQSLT